MSWNKTWIDSTARGSARADNALFEAIGLEQMEDARVLDAGCFDGYNTYLKFGPFGNIAQVTGVDPVPERIEEARENIRDERFGWQCSSFESYCEDPESYDVVYFSHALQHMEDKAAALQSAYRALKPGGFVIIKTIDDTFNVSSPDPERLMERTYELYESKVIPYTEHTHFTDRRFGHSCPGLLTAAGFDNIAMRVLLNESTGLDEEGRVKLFERGTYFRAKVPQGAGEQTAAQMHELLSAWEQLFRSEGYYFASATVLIVAQKPQQDEAAASYQGPLFGGVRAAAADERVRVDTCSINPMTEGDLGEVMGIEMKSFPDPWVPIAYALELRYNSCAHYTVLRDAGGALKGYLGWWENDGYATIAHIAVDPDARRGGYGRKLLDLAFAGAREAGCHTMQLQVRAANTVARAFYAAMGFAEAAVSKGYYTNPDDDAVIMIRALDGSANSKEYAPSSTPGAQDTTIHESEQQ